MSNHAEIRILQIKSQIEKLETQRAKIEAEKERLWGEIIELRPQCTHSKTTGSMWWTYCDICGEAS